MGKTIRPNSIFVLGDKKRAARILAQVPLNALFSTRPLTNESVYPTVGTR